MVGVEQHVPHQVDEHGEFSKLAHPQSPPGHFLADERMLRDGPPEQFEAHVQCLVRSVEQDACGEESRIAMIRHVIVSKLLHSPDHACSHSQTHDVEVSKELGLMSAHGEYRERSSPHHLHQVTSSGEFEMAGHDHPLHATDVPIRLDLRTDLPHGPVLDPRDGYPVSEYRSRAQRGQVERHLICHAFPSIRALFCLWNNT